MVISDCMLCIRYTDEVSMTGYSSDTNDVELDQHGLTATFEGASVV